MRLSKSAKRSSTPYEQSTIGIQSPRERARTHCLQSCVRYWFKEARQSRTFIRSRPSTQLTCAIVPKSVKLPRVCQRQSVSVAASNLFQFRRNLSDLLRSCLIQEIPRAQLPSAILTAHEQPSTHVNNATVRATCWHLDNTGDSRNLCRCHHLGHPLSWLRQAATLTVLVAAPTVNFSVCDRYSVVSTTWYRRKLQSFRD